jgi:hypothetical protein
MHQRRLSHPRGADQQHAARRPAGERLGQQRQRLLHLESVRERRLQQVGGHLRED